MIVSTSQILKNYIFGPYLYNFFQEDIKKIKKFINSYLIYENNFVDFDKYELIFIFDGSCKIFYRNKLICKIFLKTPYIIGETSYINTIKKNINFSRIGTVKADTLLNCLSINLENFDKFPIDLKIYFAERIFKNLTNKITLSNMIYEKYKKINKIIKEYFSLLNENITIKEIEKKITSIIKCTSAEKIIISKKEYFDIENIFQKKDKFHIKRKFHFLKRKVIPQIKPLQLLPDNLIYQIAQNGIWIKFYKDDIIIHQGEKSDGCFFIIIEGNVNIIVNNEIINNLKGCFMIGEMTLIQFPGQLSLRTATVKAKETTFAIKVDSNMLKAYHSKNKLQLYNSIIVQLLERLKDLNEKIYKETGTIENFINNLYKSEQISEKELNLLNNSIFTFSTKGISEWSHT